MNEEQKDLPGQTRDDSSDLRAEIAALRQQVWTMLVLALVVSGVFTIYLTSQVKFASKDLSEVNQVIEQGKAMDQFLQRLADYGKSHPDFMPILTKYGIMVTSNNPAAPAPIAPPKK